MNKNVISISITEEILNLYTHAKEAILFFETHERVTSTEAAIELRDCLDHLMLAFSNSSNSERFQAEINYSLEHLRRGAIEPLEYAVENRLADISKRYKWKNLYSLLLISTAKNELFKSKLNHIKNKIINGRNCKNLDKWQEGVNHFKEAYELSLQLEKMVPERDIINGRLFALILTAFFFLLGYIIG